MSPATLTNTPFSLPLRPTETELVAKYFRVLSDRARLSILETLTAKGELTVGALVERLDLAQPSVSNHLECLRWCGFVESRREGRAIYNRIADARVVQMIELARELLAENKEHVAACRRA